MGVLACTGGLLNVLLMLDHISLGDLTLKGVRFGGLVSVAITEGDTSTVSGGAARGEVTLGQNTAHASIHGSMHMFPSTPSMGRKDASSFQHALNEKPSAREMHVGKVCAIHVLRDVAVVGAAVSTPVSSRYAAIATSTKKCIVRQW